MLHCWTALFNNKTISDPPTGGERNNETMTDNFKQKISEEFEDLEENVQQSIVKPVQDEVGKAIETATQAVFGPTDPAKIQQQEQEQAKKKQEDQKKLINVKRFLSQMAQDEHRLKQQRQEEQQKEQEKEQDEKEVVQTQEIQKQKKKTSFAQEHIKAEQSKAERKLGVGG